MSKVKIQGNASGSGTLLIAAPDTDEIRTINLPDSNGTILDENSSLPAANVTGTHTSFTSTGIDDNATNPAILIDGNGAVTIAEQPAFLARNTVTRTSVTGNSVTYTVVFDSEVFDQGTDFSTVTYTFTAPVTGTYFLTAMVGLGDITPTNTDASISIVTSNRTYQRDFNPGNLEASGATGVASANISTVADMDSGDTAYVTIQVHQGGQTIHVVGSNFTSFSGFLHS